MVTMRRRLKWQCHDCVGQRDRVGQARDRLEDIEKMRQSSNSVEVQLELDGASVRVSICARAMLELVVGNDLARDSLRDGDRDEIFLVDDKVEDEVKDYS